MRKIVCSALGHRLRVVQEFTPQCRRIKCERCGGDWGMNDAHDELGIKAALVPWDPDFEQIFRDRGFEILEPAEFPVPVEPPTWGELWRACRWQGALAITLSATFGHTVIAAGIDGWVSLVVTTVVSWAIGRSLGRWAIDRAYERKRRTLQA